MRVNKLSFINILIAISLISLISIFVANRSFDVGDTYQYKLHYENISGNESYGYKFEPGFNLLAYVVSRLSVDYAIFFFVVTFVITVTYFYLFKRAHEVIIPSRLLFGDIFLFFSFLILSSWYVASVSNGLRQGLSLPFLYLSFCYFLFNRSVFKSVVLYAISISFHYSSLLVLPFFILLLFELKTLSLAWIMMALGYVVGLNEMLVMHMSSITGINIYDKIKYYSIDEGDIGRYHGLVFSFLIYTVFWPLAFLIIHYVRFGNYDENCHEVLKLVKIYMVLSMPYFVFGFGPFSNRYSYIAWFFIPLLQFFMVVYYFRDLRIIARVISFAIFLPSFLYFIFLIN